MSEQQNKSEEKSVDTAPYLKKDNNSKASSDSSSKDNFVIPAVLLLVSAIVIVATFYEEEYKTFIAGYASDDDTTEEATEVILAEPAINTATTIDAETADATAETPVSSTDTVSSIDTDATDQAEISEDETVTDTAASGGEMIAASAEQDTASDTDASEKDADTTGTNIAEAATEQPARSAESDSLQEAVKAVATTTPYMTGTSPYSMPAYTPYQPRQINYQDARNQAMARAQEQSRQHDLLIQQRRAAYEQEVSEKRQQYEAHMKAYQEKRAEIAAAQKAIFQQVEHDRIEAGKKMQEMHQKINALHEELHRMMADRQAAFQSAIKNSTMDTAEHM